MRKLIALCLLAGCATFTAPSMSEWRDPSSAPRPVPSGWNFPHTQLPKDFERPTVTVLISFQSDAISAAAICGDEFNRVLGKGCTYACALYAPQETGERFPVIYMEKPGNPMHWLSKMIAERGHDFYLTVGPSGQIQFPDDWNDRVDSILIHELDHVVQAFLGLPINHKGFR